MTEDAFTFDCAGETLVGILSVPENTSASRAVLVVVGGPQYRSGSHRQFTLLARALAAQGFPAMRFDYRGLGDSEGELRTFEVISEDIEAAIDALCGRLPAVKEVVLWGLCDAASAILFYAWRDPRVIGIVLLNPWVYTPQGEARTLLRHYYLRKLASSVLWRKLWRGEFGVRRSARSLWNNIRTSLTPHAGGASGEIRTQTVDVPVALGASLPDRMADGLERYPAPVLLILSGKDLTAQEFKDYVAGSPRWQRLLSSPRVRRVDAPEATHTFSSRAWRRQVEVWTAEWTAALGTLRAAPRSAGAAMHERMRP